MFRLVSLIFRNALRNRRRSLLTILSIATSLSLLGVMLALYHSFFLTQPTREEALRLVTRHRVSITGILPISYLDQIRQVPGVREAMIMQWFGGNFKDPGDTRNLFPRFSIDPERLFVIFPEYVVPGDQKQAFIYDRTACMIGRPVAERLGLKLGDRINLAGDIWPVNLQLTLRAIYDSDRDRENLLFHHEYLRQSLPRGMKDIASFFAILAESPEAVPGIIEAIDARFRNSTAPTLTETARNFELSFLSYLGNVKFMIFAIGAAVSFTLLLVSANTVSMSVRERIPEVGILKTLGFSPGAILSLIIGESAFIAVLGGLLGLLFTALVCAVLRDVPLLLIDLRRVQLTAQAVAVTLCLAALIGAASAAWPAWSAARRPIVLALRFRE
jgi:putative ABC transport system permease protein